MNSVDAGIVTANATAKFAKKNTPQFAKNTLTGVKHIGESGINLITNSKTANWISNQTGQLVDKVRTGPALFFNAKLKAGVGSIKSIGDLAQSDKITQLMIMIIGLLFFVIFLWCYNKISLDAKN